MKSFTIQIELDSVRFFNFFFLDFTIVREKMFSNLFLFPKLRNFRSNRVNLTGLSHLSDWNFCRFIVSN